MPMREFSAHTRRYNFQRLGRELFDLLIVGGGITGAGIARDASLRGYRVALIDKSDFASGTSSKSSKMVHGGVRYMEQFEFGLVYEASRERRTLMQIAPHLVQPLPFVFPVYRDARWSPRMIDVGLWLYDALAMFRNVKRHKMLSRDQVGQMMHGIDTRHIDAAAYYYDAQVDDARLTLETIRAAHRHGAAIANYVQADGLLKEKGRVVGAQAHDVFSGEKISIHAHIVVNATGPWTDALLQIDDPRAPPRMRPTKGIHVLVPREKIGGGAAAVTFPSFSDGRLMFIIPWGEFAIIGSTESDYAGDFDRVYADTNDVAYVMAAVNHAFPDAQLQKTDIISTYAGLRPLVVQPGKSAHRTSREHQIWTSESGLVTMAGGKLTTYRSMAQELVDRVAKRLRAPVRSSATARTMLVDSPLAQRHLGESNSPRAPTMTMRDPMTPALPSALPQGKCAYGASVFDRDDLRPPPRAGGEVIAHLIRAHGPEYPRVSEIAERDARLAGRVIEGLPYIWAEVQYALEQEMAMTVADVLARRTHILLESRENGLQVAPEVAAWLGKFFDWDKRAVEKDLRAYEEQVGLTLMFK